MICAPRLLVLRPLQRERRQWKERPFLRPLMVFRDNSLYFGSQDRQRVFRRDFHLASGEKFDTNGSPGPARTPGTQNMECSGGPSAFRATRAWSAVPFPLSEGRQTISAVVLTGDVLWVASSRGGLRRIGHEAWPAAHAVGGPARRVGRHGAAEGRLFLSTRNGRVVCLGSEPKAPAKPAAGRTHAFSRRVIGAGRIGASQRCLSRHSALFCASSRHPHRTTVGHPPSPWVPAAA